MTTVILVCEATGKRAYLAHNAARLALGALRRKEKEGRLSVYRCRTCRRYHLGNDRRHPRRPQNGRPRAVVKRELKMSSATRAQAGYRLRCPSCTGPNVRVNVMGEAILLVGIDPTSGEIKHGKQVGFSPSEPVPIYFCRDCDYENVAPVIFTEGE